MQIEPRGRWDYLHTSSGCNRKDERRQLSLDLTNCPVALRIWTDPRPEFPRCSWVRFGEISRFQAQVRERAIDARFLLMLRPPCFDGYAEGLLGWFCTHGPLNAVILRGCIHPVTEAQYSGLVSPNKIHVRNISSSAQTLRKATRSVSIFCAQAHTLPKEPRSAFLDSPTFSLSLSRPPVSSAFEISSSPPFLCFSRPISQSARSRAFGCCAYRVACAISLPDSFRTASLFLCGCYSRSRVRIVLRRVYLRPHTI